AEDGIRDLHVTGVQTCALPISSISDGKLVFIGTTGSITDQVNPDLHVPEGAVVQINLVNDDGAIHDVAIPEFNVKSDTITGKGEIGRASCRERVSGSAGAGAVE